ncbi:MAG: helix-turn-helix domain-containing protein [Streptosporangiaceae bacterium]
MAEPQRGQDWLSATLRDLRQAAGLSGMEAARRLGTSQRRISNIETGRFVPRDDEIQAFADHYRASRATRRQLLEVVRDLRAEPPKARVVMARGAWKMQRRIARVEAASSRIRAFHCAIVLGLVQTPAYARAVFSDGGDITGEDLERCVSERLDRQRILSSGQDITLLMTEGALRWQASGPAVMAEQLDHIAMISHRPGVRVGVIPWTTPAGVFPLHGFTVYDSRAVIIGTRVATAFLTDSQDVAEHEKLLGELEALAAWDAAARDHLGRIAADFRALI